LADRGARRRPRRGRDGRILALRRPRFRNAERRRRPAPARPARRDAAAGVLLHEKTINTLGLQWGYEFWQRSDPPYSYRLIKGPTEAASTDSTIQTYDPATNTTSAQSDPQPKHFDDTVANLRK